MNKEQELELCVRCKKNKATLTYADSKMDVIHNFIERICQECYDKQVKNSNWYKKGYQEARKEFERLIDKLPDKLKKIRVDDKQVKGKLYKAIPVFEISYEELEQLKNQLRK